MKLTVTLDADAYTFASAYAGAKGITISAALNELVRRVEDAAATSEASSRLRRNEYGYLEIAPVGATLTPKTVQLASEDEIV